MKKILWAALAAVAMFVTSCGSSVEYETLTKDYNNRWKVSAVVPKGVYKLNDTLPAAIPAAIQEAASISKPLYLAGDKIAIGFTKGEVYDQTFATWAANYKDSEGYKDINIAGRKGFRKNISERINDQPTLVGYEYYVEAPEVGEGGYFVAEIYPTTEKFDDLGTVLESPEIVQVLDSLKLEIIK